jgi:hypothetical protein
MEARKAKRVGGNKEDAVWADETNRWGCEDEVV